MKSGIKKMSFLVIALMMSGIAFGQTPAATPAPAAQPAAAPTQSVAPTIKGTLDIDYKSRMSLDDKGRPTAGVKDIYKMDITVVDTVVFRGIIEHLPPIFSTVLGREQQSSNLTYGLDVIVRNPANLSQEKRAGKLTGGVPIDKNGVYQYGNGNLRMAIDAMGKASAFESAFRGTAAGKPPKTGSMAESAAKKALAITKSVGGKTQKIMVTKYDQMRLDGLGLPKGPADTYPETTVNGEMVYDYERYAWYFRGATMTYVVDGKTITDRLSGNIKWNESPQRATNGEGWYDFDVRVNEPEVKEGEAAAFQTTANESDFFAVDTTMPSLTGTAKYKDTMNGETVVSSRVSIDLIGNNLNKPQVVNLDKLLWLVSIVPMNAE